MLFDNLQREKVSKREGYLCFFLSRLSKFSCMCVVSGAWLEAQLDDSPPRGHPKSALPLPRRGHGSLLIVSGTAAPKGRERATLLLGTQ
jgi:hypothetical protein